uniref:Large ribosomal subunit protein uL29c n=1 Tax=Eustigmatophyceae sp. Chic 10/23 P-6w TaxID=1446905 RepID=A0A3R5U001_9STRA|nr:ribosomal protein L29 [Eustigmatophyceae sp. Chic 10/23 P-6w]QAA11530.1 ribosomal protein L29 [Eustigmatophyceae sp. Chic 10/23 P-6w]
MALTKYQDIKKLDDKELDDLILKLKKELLFLRIQKVNFSSLQPHLFRHTKHQLAQLLTWKREKLNNSNNLRKIRKNKV